MKFRRLGLLAAAALVATACSTGSPTQAPAATTAPAESAAASDAASPAAEACPEKAQALSGKTIGVIYLTEAHPYYQAHMKWTEQFAAACGITLVEVDGKADAAVMSTAMDQLIAQKVDGIIFALLDPAAADPSINDALAAGIPVVTFAIRHGANAHVPFVGIPENVATEAAGKEAAARFHAKFGPDTAAKLTIVDCPTIQAVVDRSDGFVKGFTETDAKAVVIDRIDGGCAREKAVKAMEDSIQAHPDVNVVYGGNGDNSLGALAALQGANLGTSDKVFLTSHDGSEPELQELVKASSALKLSVANRPQELSRATLETLGEVVSGARAKDQDSNVLVEAAVLNPDDIDALNTFLHDQYFATTDLVAQP
jgi:ribose transport system substrate-binding protein